MFTAPHLSYALLAPILVVLGGALLGVLVEAFLKQSIRRVVQVNITLTTLVVAFIQLLAIRNKPSSLAAITSVSIDKAGIFMQATILVLAFVGTLLIADQDNFTAQASAIPGSGAEAASIISGDRKSTRLNSSH